MSGTYAVRVPRGYRVGRWEVREPIATGAFGSVYAARRRPDDSAGPDDPAGPAGPDSSDRPDDNDAPTGLPRSAALKFLPTGTRTPRQLTHLRELAERERELLSRLTKPRLANPRLTGPRRTSPHLIRLYETLTVDDPSHPDLDGATVLVLEKAEDSLSALLKRTPAPATGPLLLAQVCAGLSQLHCAGWVHGDLKPANVLLMKDGSARLADFNMAAELEGTHGYTPAFSTPDYTPPELLWAEIGERGRRIRPSADVWAFGVLTHLVLTGSFPLPGATPAARRDAAVAYARGTAELRLSPGLPAAWAGIVRACLARTHAERVGTDALLPRVEEAAGTGTPPRLLGLPLPRALLRAPLTRRARHRRTAVALGSAAATAAVAVLGYGLTHGTDPGGEPQDGKNSAAVYGASELRTDKGVPVRYRRMIVDSAHECLQREVSPVLIAAMLKAESDFDPDLSDPATGEYGIARWTPAVLRWWIRADGVPASATPRPPLSATESIRAMGRYLCFIEPRLTTSLPGDRRLLIAASYRTSYKKVNAVGGIPPQCRGYTVRVARYLKEYTPPAQR
ncbi:protein kinase domain-containing protein [Streptomyces sp. T028]|uniref:protein kinase domain-containing protein n=1 Tax=Streptomyces sp. T028 TaxID=3394379 RepID=UPI003A84D92E